jgi:hypothetical protein
MRGFLEVPSSNLGHRYIIARLAVRLYTSGNMLEHARRMREL